jgi:hypothetical protein
MNIQQEWVLGHSTKCSFHFFNRNNISIFAANYLHAKLFRIQFQDRSASTME